MTTDNRSESTSATSKTDRTDAELASFNPTRMTPTVPGEQSRWTDYDFNSLDEFVRWSNIRRTSHEAAQPNRVAIPHPTRG